MIDAAKEQEQKESLGEFLSHSTSGKVFCLCVFLVGCVFLLMSEQDRREARVVVYEAKSNIVEVAQPELPDAGLEGRLIYGVSQLQTNEILNDDMFDVAIQAVKLIRSVSYFQWVETEYWETVLESDGRKTYIPDYAYEKAWVREPISSAQFTYAPEHENKALTQIESVQKLAQTLQWGAYTLDAALLGADETAPVLLKLSEEKKASFGQQLHIRDNMAYIGANPDMPAIGDVRIQMYCVPIGKDLSLIAQVQGEKLGPYTSKSGRTFFSARSGNINMDAMFRAERRMNTLIVGFCRLLGFLFVSLGLGGMISWLYLLFEKIPFLESVQDAGTTFISVMLGLTWSFLFHAAAWLPYRPLVFVAALLTTVLVLWLLKKTGDTVRKRIEEDNLIEGLIHS